MAVEVSSELEPQRRAGPDNRVVYLLLALIFTLGLGLRIAGLTWSLPDARHPIATYHPDELVNLAAAEQADLAHGKIDIGFYNYGAFYFYLVSLSDTIGHGYGLIPNTANIDPKSVSEAEALRLQGRERAGEFLAGRLVTALMGAATIPVVFLLGVRLYSRRTGLLAALLYALAPLPALHAHFLTVDVPATLFVSLTLLSAANLRVIGSFREVALAGIGCGLATATKYTAVVCVVAPLCALALGAAQTSGPERNAALRTGALKAATLIGVMAAAFLVACPGPWLNWGAFWNGTYPGSGVRYELFEHARTGHGYLFTDTGPGWWYHLSVSLRYGLGLPLLLLSAVGCAYAVRRRTPSDIILLAFLVVAYSATSLSAVRFARYLIPLTPALCVLAARVAVEPYARRIASRIALASAALTVAACALTTGGLVRALTLKDPRDRAADYLAGHAGSHAAFAFAHTPWFYSPPLSPLWGSVRSESRKNASPAQPNIEFRMPDGDWDPRVLSPPPDFLVLSNIELLPEWKRLRLPAAVAFMSLIPPGGWQTVFKPSAVFGLSPDDPDVPQDILYVLPEITVYEWKGR